MRRGVVPATLVGGLFGKPASFARRRMGVALARAGAVDEARARATDAAAKVRVTKD